MVDHRKISGPEFVIIDGIVGDCVQSDSKYFIGRDTSQSPLRWGIPFSASVTKDNGIAQLMNHGLAHVDRKWLIMDRPACIELRGKILNDMKSGLLGQLLKKLVVRAGDKPGELVDPDGIYGSLGIDNHAYILTKTLMDRGLISQHPQYRKITGVNYALVVSDEAKRIVNRGHDWLKYFFGFLRLVVQSPIPSTVIAVVIAGLLARWLYVRYGWNLFDPSTWKG